MRKVVSLIHAATFKEKKTNLNKIAQRGGGTNIEPCNYLFIFLQNNT